MAGVWLWILWPMWNYSFPAGCPDSRPLLSQAVTDGHLKEWLSTLEMDPDGYLGVLQRDQMESYRRRMRVCEVYLSAPDLVPDGYEDLLIMRFANAGDALAAVDGATEGLEFVDTGLYLEGDFSPPAPAPPSQKVVQILTFYVRSCLIVSVEWARSGYAKPVSYDGRAAYAKISPLMDDLAGVVCQPS